MDHEDQRATEAGVDLLVFPELLDNPVFLGNPDCQVFLALMAVMVPMDCLAYQVYKEFPAHVVSLALLETRVTRESLHWILIHYF